MNEQPINYSSPDYDAGWQAGYAMAERILRRIDEKRFVDALQKQADDAQGKEQP